MPSPVELLTIERLRLSAAVRAPATLKAYEQDWRQFSRWCQSHSLAELPASSDTVALFVTAELNRGKRITSVTRKITAISWAHRKAGLPSPATGGDIALLLRGARRIRCEQPVQKAPVSVADLQRLCQMPAAGLTWTRNLAILLFAFATALRRSNIAALDLADLTFSPRGITVHVGKSKTDQTGIGFQLAIPYGQHITCPVKAFDAWMKYRGNDPGAVFQGIHNGRIDPRRLHPNRISLVIKELMGLLGYDVATVGSHSARSGHVTEALANGVDHLLIMRTTRHSSVNSLRAYERMKDPFKSNSCALLGL